ncbi:MAG: hypothetical protein MAG715_00853 [Methanonatronarchaeales archaeon]|nr:hypothetical protein [Methanonatronarchaeales archaeon]
MRVETLEELDEALELLRRDAPDEEVEASISVSLDGETLKRVARRFELLDDCLEVDGTCTLSGVFTRDDVGVVSMEERLEDLAERVENLSRELASL